MPLQVLADELDVHARTLRAAAHDGRLAVTFGPRPFFGKLTATATREAACNSWWRGIAALMDVADVTPWRYGCSIRRQDE